MIKKLKDWFIEAIRETVGLSWTLVGLIISYFTLTGAAQRITGMGIIITLAVWLVTINFRKQ